jgi:DNA-binding CsgD family transcriptional regulator/PAS domain-containing protein
VAAISSEVSATIDAATFGSGSWDEVPAALSSAFPGSWGGVYNMNFPENRLNFMSLQNMEPAFVNSFAEHFAYVNPWAAYWTSLRSTTIAASEDVYPARSIAKSEFYNDWLLPQNTEAAVGMKLVGERGEAVHVLLHFPLSSSGVYDKAGLEIMRRVRGSFERSVNLARLFRTDVEAAIAEAALVERSQCAAFVVAGDRLLREANRTAEQLFSLGQGVAVRNGRCYLMGKEADARFGAALEKLAAGTPTLASRIGFRTATGAWQVSLAAIPLPRPSPASILSLLPPRRMVLVLVVDLGLQGADTADLASLSTLFGLTPSEIAFCRRLLLGESVADAAEQLGVTEGTARTRLKMILQKTGTSRQGQLMLLLSRAR